MDAILWLIAGINLTMAAQALPAHDWSHLSAGIITLILGACIK